MKQDANLGSVGPGLIADLVAFDTQSWKVAHSWIGGQHQKH
jgi:predicted amidohydrolase YtcJ